MHKIEIIVSQYSSITGNIFGARLTTEDIYDSEDAAVRAAKPFIREGFSVIVRPKSVARDKSPKGFHEWRSFDGKPFEKIEFKAF